MVPPKGAICTEERFYQIVHRFAQSGDVVAPSLNQFAKWLGHGKDWIKRRLTFAGLRWDVPTRKILYQDGDSAGPAMDQSKIPSYNNISNGSLLVQPVVTPPKDCGKNKSDFLSRSVFLADQMAEEAAEDFPEVWVDWFGECIDRFHRHIRRDIRNWLDERMATRGCIPICENWALANLTKWLRRGLQFIEQKMTERPASPADLEPPHVDEPCVDPDEPINVEAFDKKPSLAGFELIKNALAQIGVELPERLYWKWFASLGCDEHICDRLDALRCIKYGRVENPLGFITAIMKPKIPEWFVIVKHQGPDSLHELFGKMLPLRTEWAHGSNFLLPHIGDILDDVADPYGYGNIMRATMPPEELAIRDLHDWMENQIDASRELSQHYPIDTRLGDLREAVSSSDPVQIRRVVRGITDGWVKVILEDPETRHIVEDYGLTLEDGPFVVICVASHLDIPIKTDFDWQSFKSRAYWMGLIEGQTRLERLENEK
jgi:hypothetical protein